MELLTPKEASEVLRVSVHTLAKWRTTGQGPDYAKTGKSVKYEKGALDRWIGERTTKHA